MRGIYLRGDNFILRCPKCGEEWTSRAERHREEWGWDVQIEEENCLVCGSAGRVEDEEDGALEAADFAYDEWRAS